MLTFDEARTLAQYLPGGVWTQMKRHAASELEQEWADAGYEDGIGTSDISGRAISAIRTGDVFTVVVRFLLEAWKDATAAFACPVPALDEMRTTFAKIDPSAFVRAGLDGGVTVEYLIEHAPPEALAAEAN